MQKVQEKLAFCLDLKVRSRAKFATSLMLFMIPNISTLSTCSTNDLSFTLLYFVAYFYNSIFYPVWKHLDERGFGTPQPFICWLLIPFVLSMIVWYFSVIELMDLADWESKMGPIPTALEPENDFTWGEL